MTLGKEHRELSVSYIPLFFLIKPEFFSVFSPPDCFESIFYLCP